MAWPRRLVRTVSCFQWPEYVSGSYAEYGVDLGGARDPEYDMLSSLPPPTIIVISTRTGPTGSCTIPHRMNSWKAFTTCFVAMGMCTVSKGEATAQVPPLYLPSRQPTVLPSPSTPIPTRNSHLFRYSVCGERDGRQRSTLILPWPSNLG